MSYKIGEEMKFERKEWCVKAVKGHIHPNRIKKKLFDIKSSLKNQRTYNGHWLVGKGMKAISLLRFSADRKDTKEGEEMFKI